MATERALEAATRMKSTLESLRGALDAGSGLDEAGLLLSGLADRFIRPLAPMVLAVCGPTGAGKSHLVNYLAGGPVSPSSYRRPSTVAPVLVGRAGQLAGLGGGGFLPGYRQIEAPGGAVFPAPAEDGDEAAGGLKAEARADDRLYLVPAIDPPWAWPEELVIIDTPDFDSVRLANQTQSRDMARRADALILVAHQAKYADQSTWDFLAAEGRSGRPLLVILNRVTAAAAVEDFKERLQEAGFQAPVLPWPEETAVGQVAVGAARRELAVWLEDMGRRSRELTAAGGRRLTARLALVLRDDLASPLSQKERRLSASLASVERVTREWLEQPRDRVALHLPGETRESLLKGLSEVVSRSDLWARPRRWLAKPFELLEAGFKRVFGQNEGQASAEQKLADSLVEAGREALVTAVRDEARALAEAAGWPSPQADLDYSPDQIRVLHAEMTERLNQWLKEEMDRLLAGLPLGQRAAFFLVQAAHLGLVAGLMVQTGGLPGTETLVGGALGPIISKLTGALISRENLAAFEERAARRHHQELADIFEDQGRRYQRKLESELAALAPGAELEPELAAIEQEAKRLWA